MKLQHFMEGLGILYGHCDPADYQTGAGHDQFFFYATRTQLSDFEVARMRELGWFQPDHLEKDGYDPDNGWSCWV